MNGYTPSPKPHPRIKPEAQENAMRNRGGMEKWFDYDNNIDNYNSPRPGDRLTTADAKHIAEVNKGCMGEFMEGYPDPPVKRELHPRGVTQQAASIANNSKGQGMKNLIDNYGNLEVSDRPQPKVKGENANEYVERSHGVVDDVINNYGHHPVSPQPAAKVYYGGQDVAEKYKGKEMGGIIKMEENGKRSPREGKQGRLHQESDGAGWDETPPHVRIRPNAEDILTKNSKSDMGEIIRGVPSPDDKTFKHRNVKHMTESEVPRPRTSPARTRPEAMQYYQKNNDSEMGAILGGKASMNGVHSNPNHRRMLAKSEDW